MVALKKGRIEINTIIIILIVLIVFALSLGIFLNVWNLSIPSLIGDKNLMTECSRWQEGNCIESLDILTDEGELKYPTLYDKYGGNVDAGKKYCNCP